MTLGSPDWKRILHRLRKLYGDTASACLPRIQRLVETYAPSIPDDNRGWDQRDIVLITYGDQIRTSGRAPLNTLGEFLRQHNLNSLINTIHLLPFFPYSSDDGFSVIDFRQVDPGLGTWEDIQRLGDDFSLMFDLVLNHASRQGDWFRSYLDGMPPYSGYFIECDPRADYSSVTRPRSLPLLTPIETPRGTRHLWTTFSPDQIDLNYRNPDVLIEMLDVLLMYVRQGARIIRLDAIAYLWKELGTPCIHLDETHEIVKLMRDVLEAVAPSVRILTETNVPHQENVSYFGDADEAHFVYQFSLPPLLLDAFVHSDASYIHQWLSTLDAPQDGTNYFNFTASHDGIGVRPLEGLVPNDRLDSLVRHVKSHGGCVSTRAQADGRHTPYELNISYVDALADHAGEDPVSHANRFLASQALMLAAQGIPGIYFHSLVGSQNDIEGMLATDQARRINRHKYTLEELSTRLSSNLLQRQIFQGYQDLLRRRIEQPAFHPDASQNVLQQNDPHLLMFVRTSINATQSIVVVTNFAKQPKTVHRSQLGGLSPTQDLICGRHWTSDRLTVAPSTTVWLLCE